MTTAVQSSWVALVGNPNSGKTAIFNLLTGLNQKVSNYPGVTVEKKTGQARFADGSKFYILDLPGTYSLTAESMDERIVTEQVLNWIHGHEPPGVIVSVVDATNLSRNLYLTTQLADLGIPVVVALNMMDMVKDEIKIDLEKLANDLGIAAIVPMSATEKWGQKELLEAVQKSIDTAFVENPFPIFLNDDISKVLNPLEEIFKSQLRYNERLAKAQALRLVTRQSTLEIYDEMSANGFTADEAFMNTLRDKRQAAVDLLEDTGIKHRIMEATLRYEWLDSVLTAAKINIDPQIAEANYSENLDRLLTHKWAGPAIFVLLLYFIFQSIFTWATVPMDWINRGVGWVGNQVLDMISAGMLRDLIVEGIIAGVGAILIFLPQILILMFFMTLLEDTGYMARVAFMMDRFMTMVGIRVVCLVHDVEARPHVRLEHPLFGAGQVAPVVGMEVLGVGYDGFQIAESDIRVLKEIQGWGERRVRVRPRYIGIAQKNHLDVAHCNLLLSGSPGYCSVCQAVEIVCRGILTSHYSPRQSESA